MILRAFAILGTVLIIGGGSAHGAGRPTIDQLVGFFDTVVFGSEIDARMKASVIARWTGPIRISIKGQSKPEHIAAIQNHLGAIRDLTGVRFEKVERPEKPENITILFLPAMEMSKVSVNGVDPEYIQKLAAPLSCYFLSFKKPPDTIIRGVIVVNAQRDTSAIDHCLLEELVQVMGLPNDTNMLRPSIFSDRDQLHVLSRHDEILLRTLYDERMTEGLGREAGLNVARRIMTDWDQRLPMP